MSRWIDADHAEFRLQCCGTYHGGIAFDTVKAVLNDAPSIDIVRCRECKWFDKDNLEDTYCTWSKGLCDAKPDDFCSYGERRTDD